MKPRTKNQWRVHDLHTSLAQLSASEERWAREKVLEHALYRTKHRCRCMDCGADWTAGDKQYDSCPQCGVRFTMQEKTQKRTLVQEYYFATAELCAEYQVVRNYLIRSWSKVATVARVEIAEVLQEWINPEEKSEYFGRMRSQTCSYYGWQGQMEIRKTRNRYNYYRYHITPQAYHPDSEFRYEYRRYGIDAELRGITLEEAIRYIPHIPHYETLAKARQYELLRYYIGGNGSVYSDWGSIKIALRNNYRIEDAGMWTDYLQLLSYFDKDLKNAHYVCPPDLKNAHDRLMRKKQKIDRARQEKRQRAEIAASEAEYGARVKPFLDLLIKEEGIEIRPLRSVAEFMQEGDAQAHCVFANKYYERENSLILSAKDSTDNSRLETIEVNLKEMQVEQSRGKHNGESARHDTILRIMEKNMSKIMAMGRDDENKWRRWRF